MGFIRSYTTQEPITTGGIEARATPEAFGAGLGRGLGGMADAVRGFAGVLQVQRNKAEQDAAVAQVATFDYTKRLFDRQAAAPPGAPGFYDETREDYRTAVEEHVAGVKNPRLRKSIRDELMGRLPAQSAAAARFEAEQTAAAAKNAANDGMLAIQNRIMSSPDDWHTAARDSDAIIDSQTHLPAAQREEMKNIQYQNLTRWRFEALSAAADTPEALDGIEKDLNSGKWDTVFDPADKSRIIDGIKSARSVLHTKADAEARAAIDTLRERNTAGLKIDPGELEVVKETVRKSGNAPLLWEIGKIVAQQEVLQNEERLPPAEIEARKNAANGAPGLTYPSLPAELNASINEASELTGGDISADYLGAVATKEYGEYFTQGGKRGKPDFAPVTVHEGVDLRNVSPAAVDAASVAGEIFGAPLKIMSGYRSQAKQDKIRAGRNVPGVAKHSHHTAGNAFDISTVGMSQAEQARMVDALVQAGFTGFGQYKSHIHADLREAVPSSYGERDGSTWGGWTTLSPEIAGVLKGYGFGADVSAASIERGTRAAPVETIDWGKGNTAGASNAVGAFQFIPTTWLDITRREEYADTFGVSPEMSDEEVLALRADPRLSTIGAAIYAKENKATVEETIGRDITDAELYMAHFLGAGGAIAFLNAYKSQPTESAATVLPDAAASNPKVFYDGETALTVAEVYGRITASFNGAPSAATHAENEARQKIIDRQKKAFEGGYPIEYLIESGARNVGALDTPEAFARRGADAQFGANYFQSAVEDFPPFTREEAATIGKQIKEGDADAVLNIMDMMQGMGQDVARAAYKQIGQEDPVFEYAANQAHEGNDVVAADIVRGQKRLEENPDVKGLIGRSPEDILTTFNTEVDKALLGLSPRDAQAVREAALAHYTETFLARGAGNIGTFDDNAYTASINAVLGGKEGAPAIGEVNGAKVLLPQGMTAEDVDLTLERMTIEDYAAVSVDGNPPRYMDGDLADTEDIAAEGKLRAVGTDTYQVQMADGNMLAADVDASTGRVVPYTMELTSEFGKKVIARVTTIPQQPDDTPQAGGRGPAVTGRPGGGGKWQNPRGGTGGGQQPPVPFEESDVRRQQVGPASLAMEATEPPKEKGFMAKVSNWMFGEPEAERGYPTQAEAHEAMVTGQFYGNPIEPFTQRDIAKVMATNKDSAVHELFGEGKSLNLDSGSPTLALATEFAQAGLAVRSSAIASLGFDPRKVITHGTDTKFDVAGFYVPGTDTIWFDPRYKSTLVHESIHRGIEKLVKDGAKLEGEDEELLVRRMMQRYFADVERGQGKEGDKQVEKAYQRRYTLDPIIDRLEAIAQKRIAKSGVRSR